MTESILQSLSYSVYKLCLLFLFIKYKTLITLLSVQIIIEYKIIMFIVRFCLLLIFYIELIEGCIPKYANIFVDWSGSKFLLYYDDG